MVVDRRWEGDLTVHTRRFNPDAGAIPIVSTHLMTTGGLRFFRCNKLRVGGAQLVSVSGDIFFGVLNTRSKSSKF